MNKLILYVGIIVLGCVTAFADAEQKVSSLIFIHYRYENSTSNEFEVKRAYLTYANKLNDALSYKIQLDVGAGDVSSYSAYLKTAKIDWKTSLGKITLGIQGMNMLKIQEKTWGYRFIEKAVMDRKKFSSSSDLGLGWSNKYGLLNTSVMITNGNGYKHAETDGHKKVSGRLHLGQSKLESGYNTGVVFSHEGIDYGTNSTGSSVVLGGFGGLALNALTIGAEYNIHKLNTDSEITSTLMAAYGRLLITDKLLVFARTDLFDQDNQAENDSEIYFLSGLIYTPEPGLSIAPNIRIISSENGDSQSIYYVNFQFIF